MKLLEQENRLNIEPLFDVAEAYAQALKSSRPTVRLWRRTEVKQWVVRNRRKITKGAIITAITIASFHLLLSQKLVLRISTQAT